jgi:sulfhydrogenase subunit delta
MNKLRIGWFTFTCCEDSTMMFIELLNDHFFEWKDHIEFIHAKVLQSNNRWEPMDVSFVEGAITNDEQVEKLKKIRELSKKIIAIGSCACTGAPSNMRNFFDDATKVEISPVIEKFKYAPLVRKLDDVVQIDGMVPGCPMDEKKFLEIINNLLKINNQ